VREEQVRLFGASYIDVVQTNKRIGLASLDVGDPVAAIASYREAIEGMAAQSGAGGPQALASARMKLGASLLDARRLDEAERELREALAVLAPMNHLHAVETRGLLTMVLTRYGRLQEAEAMLAPSLAQPPANPVDVARFKSSLGQLRSAQGRHAEAASLLREAHELYVQSGTPSSAAVSLATLGDAQLAAGSAADALATLQRADLLLDKVHPNGSPDHADLLTDLARAQLELGRPPEAVAAARRADEFWTRFDAGNRHAGLAALWHARALLAAGQAQQAAQASTRASVILTKAALPADRTLLTQTLREVRSE
jgi:tetratricopeptide (TPR) repeat protein